jgi:hypothetical protein
MNVFKTRTQISELMSYVSGEYLNPDTGALEYVVGVNFTCEDYAELQDSKRTAGARVLLTIYEENGTLIQSGKQIRQEVNFRFLAKGTSPSGAKDRAKMMHEWLVNKRTFATASYRFWCVRTPKTPSFVGKTDSGSFLADFVVTLLVLNRV